MTAKDENSELRSELESLRKATMENTKDIEVMTKSIDLMSENVSLAASSMAESSKNVSELTIEIKDLVASNKYSEKERARLENDLDATKADLKILNTDYTKNKPLWDQSKNTVSKIGIVAIGVIVTMVLIGSMSVYVSTGGKPTQIQTVKK
tara:strand:+ start:664 stop:1116 length:453 start_codon:yes stop_codon:yes gene_type:complete